MKAQVLQRYQQELVVGIDIAKQTHVAVALSPEGKFSKAFSFKHDRAGLKSLVEWLARCQARLGGRSVVLGLESTSHYGKALERFLVERGMPLRVVSTLLTRRAKDMLDNSPLKTDAKDAAVIAELVQSGKSRPHHVRQEVFENLRGLAELYKRLGRDRTQLLNRLHRVLDILFPELPGLFARLDGKAIQALLRVAPTPRAVLSLGLEALSELLASASRKRLKKEKAEAIWKAALDSIGLQQGTAAQELELPWLLDQLAVLSTQRDRVEAQMLSLLDTVEYADKLLSVPGLGKVTLAILLGEVGDLRNYQSARQVLKMGGLNLYEKSSGQHQGQQRLTKRGRAYMRGVLYLAAIRLMKEGRLLHAFKLRHPKKPGPKLVVAGMRKLVEVLFAMARDNRAFENRVVAFKPAEDAGQALAA